MNKNTKRKLIKTWEIKNIMGVYKILYINKKPVVEMALCSFDWDEFYNERFKYYNGI